MMTETPAMSDGTLIEFDGEVMSLSELQAHFEDYLDESVILLDYYGVMDNVTFAKAVDEWTRKSDHAAPILLVSVDASDARSRIFLRHVAEKYEFHCCIVFEAAHAQVVSKYIRNAGVTIRGAVRDVTSVEELRDKLSAGSEEDSSFSD
jgi:hypothetical protein